MMQFLAPILDDYTLLGVVSQAISVNYGLYTKFSSMQAKALVSNTTGFVLDFLITPLRV